MDSNHQTEDIFMSEADVGMSDYSALVSNEVGHKGFKDPKACTKRRGYVAFKVVVAVVVLIGYVAMGCFIYKADSFSKQNMSKISELERIIADMISKQLKGDFSAQQNKQALVELEKHITALNDTLDDGDLLAKRNMDICANLDSLAKQNMNNLSTIEERVSAINKKQLDADSLTTANTNKLTTFEEHFSTLNNAQQHTDLTARDNMNRLTVMDDGMRTMNSSQQRGRETINNFLSVLQNHTSTIEGQERIIQTLKAQLNNSTAGQERDAIAFSAYATTTKTYRSNSIINFPATQTNVGGHYNINTYKFRCPMRGLYAFFTDITASAGKEMILCLQKEEIEIASAIADDETGNAGHDSHTSASVVIECQANEQVWVQAKCASGSCQMNGSESKYSMFSGFLIQRL